MDVSFVIAFAVLCLLVGSYMAGRMAGPVRVVVTIPDQLTVAFSGSHALAVDATVHTHNGGMKVPDGALIISPRRPVP